MNFRVLKCYLAVTVFVLLSTQNCPAPLIYTPGQGWVYENPGDDSGWRVDRAEDQLEVTKLAIEAGDSNLAFRSSKRLLAVWPLSDYAADAQFYAAEAQFMSGAYVKAFDEFQVLIDIYPKSPRYEDALRRQYDIATKFLNGQRTRILWGTVPWLPSMKKAISMNEQVIKNGPYTETAGQAQINVGLAHERKKGFFLSFTEKFTEAANAYEQAAFRYFDRPEVAADALFLAGKAYLAQARSGEYDQGHADKAIVSFEDFIALFPSDSRVAEARTDIASLKAEQSRGAYLIARFYEKRKALDSALIYYNEAISMDPSSQSAEDSRGRIARIQEIQEKINRKSSGN